METKLKKRNENKLIYDVGMFHPNLNDFLVIPKKTPFHKVIKLLEKVAKQKYTYNQITFLKQFYYNKKNKDGTPLGKTLFNWTIEYKIRDNQYVKTIENGFEELAQEKNQRKKQEIFNYCTLVWTHKLYPIVDKIYIYPNELNIKNLVEEANYKLENPNVFKWYKIIKNDLAQILTIENEASGRIKEMQLANEYYEIFKKIKQTEEAKPISEKGVKAIFTKNLNKIKGWTIEKLKNEYRD